MIAKITEQMLKKVTSTQYIITHKARLADSLAALKAEEFDLILLDLNLPDSRHLDTLTRVIEVAPEIPIIVLTASEDDGFGLQAVQLGAQDFLRKGEFNYLTLDRAIIYGLERHRLHSTLRQLAVIDELTSLYNRRGFNTSHHDVFARVKKTGLRGYLVCFDLDRFKNINDTLGHKAGDLALTEFASTLRTAFRKDTLLCRVGGDEFIAIGLEQTPGQAEDSLNTLEILLSVRNRSDDATFQLLSSAGTTYFDSNYSGTVEQLVAAADQALYENKKRRKKERGDPPRDAAPASTQEAHP